MINIDTFLLLVQVVGSRSTRASSAARKMGGTIHAPGARNTLRFDQQMRAHFQSAHDDSAMLLDEPAMPLVRVVRKVE